MPKDSADAAAAVTGPPLLLLGGGFEPHRGPSRRGIEVFGAGNGRFSAVQASRLVRQLPGAPEAWDADYGQWLSAQVAAKPGAVLLATNDDHAWWLARNAGNEGLVRATVATAPFDAIRSASLKSFMMAEAARAGLATPKSILLSSEADIAEAVAELRFPVVLKPQMRIGMNHWTRGRAVRNEAELRAAFEWYRREVTFKPGVLADAPEAAFPLAQEYVVRPGREVRHITGYLSSSGENALRAHCKLLQEPLRFGSGVCFESEPVDEVIAERLLALLRQIGYHGIFEAEFLQRGAERLLIDLNIRAFNGISLVLDSGLDLVTCAYLEATGQHAALQAELAAARAVTFRPAAWCNHAAFATLLAGQWLSGGLSGREVRRHLGWAWRNRSRTVNPAASRDDLPFAAAYLVRHAANLFVSPKEFLGRYYRTGLDR